MSEFSVFALRSPNPDTPNEREVIIAASHPGEAEFFWPVLPRLAEEPGLRTVIMAAGCADESLRTQPLPLEPLHPSTPTPSELRALCNPTLIVTGAATKNGIHVGDTPAFPDTPYILAEEYYGSANLHIGRCLEEGMRLPDRICTFDDFAKQEIIARYGRSILGLASFTEVTGQPAFDYLVGKEAIRAERNMVRDKMGLTETDMLISCFATVGAMSLVNHFAQALAKAQPHISIAFNKHPRDLLSTDAYLHTFRASGVRLSKTNGVTSRQLIAAADVVAILPHSTLALHAIQHGIPTIHVQNTHAVNGPAAHQIPVIRGVSPCVSPADFLSVAETLLDHTSPERHSLLDRMGTIYPVQSQSAAKVSAYIGKMTRLYHRAAMVD